MCCPLPLPLATSLAYAHPRTGGGDEADALTSARTELAGPPRTRPRDVAGFEAVDDYHLLAFGDPVRFDRLLVEKVDRSGVPTRFGALSWPLWSDVRSRTEEVG